MTSGHRRRGLFLDRDGVLNRDVGYVATRDRFEWIDGAIEAVARASRAGWLVFVVTNQSGVARGYFDEAAVRSLMDWMDATLRAQGGRIDDYRYCPYHPDGVIARYARESDWRKPAPGMLLDLLAKWQLDPADCHMIGDQPRDLAAATAAGMTSSLFTGGNLDDFLSPLLTAG
jgi:D-glycero-D-manno-heptose 1,7-bisphosphate phosphatase